MMSSFQDEIIEHEIYWPGAIEWWRKTQEMKNINSSMNSGFLSWGNMKVPKSIGEENRWIKKIFVGGLLLSPINGLKFLTLEPPT